MSYYGAGDYYAAGGFFSSLGKIAKGAIGAGVGFLTGGVGGAIAGSGLLRPSAPTMQQLQLPAGSPVTIGTRLKTAGQALVPGGVEPFRRKRRRMNPMNPKALNRASRRMDSFVGHARKALKHTNYKLVSKSAGKGRRGPEQIIVETGPGSVRA